jgi:hypothetical protein
VLVPDQRGCTIEEWNTPSSGRLSKVMTVDFAAKSRNEPQRAQRTQRFPLYFFVIFVFFAVKELFAVESTVCSGRRP